MHTWYTQYVVVCSRHNHKYASIRPESFAFAVDNGEMCELHYYSVVTYFRANITA